MQQTKTILVVEDEKILREAIVDALRRRNFLTIEAKNGREGVEAVLDKQPDLILLDLNMPEMDGMTAFKKIREAEDSGPHVPIIVLTNLSPNDKKIAEDIITHKPINYLIKSDWKIHDVIDKIEKALGVGSV